ncbi:leukemia NUP98 fusion partner 1 isoform X1 [Poecilia latipinna]|uniref:leukemia NUP98 fusion partner 1 isoform X1 n=1 Tax=Poecilia formosa TaxID=48698 RepID=UPI0004441AC3|nr:PREDICTED: leukemia NUP98 fusion partner 1 isoform X1 [Poecilia formosa]XP_014879666.1 PREDICTED: leukemia NUP98 fusion partner 1 isoform X1 [Poecilia latipinna]
MSLRLLPAIVMENDEDDDGNFTNWMSSYWGHGMDGGHSRERKRSFRRPSKTNLDRRASLPTVTQLDAMKLNKTHTATNAPIPKTREDKGEVRPHQRVHRISSDENRPKTAVTESRITPIPELTESFQRRLCFTDKKTMCLSDKDKMCLICHEDMCKNGEGVQELHCTHRFHKEEARRLEASVLRRSSDTVACLFRRLTEERRKSADGWISSAKEQHALRRQLSLRRHR